MDRTVKRRITAVIVAGLCALSALTLSAGPAADQAGQAQVHETDGQGLAASAAVGCESWPDPAAGNLQFSTSSLTVPESAGDRVLLVIRDGGGIGPVSAKVTTSDGTATADDYLPLAGTVSFPDGDETARVVRIPIVQDLLHEANETLAVTLSDPACATLGAPPCWSRSSTTTPNPASASAIP